MQCTYSNLSFTGVKITFNTRTPVNGTVEANGRCIASDLVYTVKHCDKIDPLCH